MEISFSRTLRHVFPRFRLSLSKFANFWYQDYLRFLTKLTQTKRKRERERERERKKRKNERDESILHDFLGPTGDGSKHEVRDNFDAKQWVVSC